MDDDELAAALEDPTRGPDESVIAAVSWADLMFVGATEAALELTAPQTRDAVRDGLIQFGPGVRELLAGDGTWANVAIPIALDREVVRIVTPEGVERLKGAYLAGRSQEETQGVTGAGFVMELHDGQWLFAEPARPEHYGVGA